MLSPQLVSLSLTVNALITLEDLFSVSYFRGSMGTQSLNVAHASLSLKRSFLNISSTGKRKMRNTGKIFPSDISTYTFHYSRNNNNYHFIAITLSVYRSRFEALPSIGSAIFAEHTVKRSNNATDNGHIYARGFADDCYGLGCDL